MNTVVELRFSLLRHAAKFLDRQTNSPPSFAKKMFLTRETRKFIITIVSKKERKRDRERGREEEREREEKIVDSMKICAKCAFVIRYYPRRANNFRSRMTHVIPYTRGKGNNVWLAAHKYAYTHTHKRTANNIFYRLQSRVTAK